MIDALRKFAAEISELKKRTATIPSIRQGRVTAVNTPASIDVETEAGTVPRVKYLASYTPALNDPVFVIEYGRGRWLCIGKVAV